MVMCSELATIVTSQDNSFLVWGSRPAILSPLHSLLAPPSVKSKKKESVEHHGLSSEAISEAPERMHRSSSLNLSNTPHSMTPCQESCNYMSVLTQLLLETRSARGEVGGGRRGSLVSSESVEKKEGVIMEPTSVDLVGRSGLLSDLSAQGLQHAKLAGVGTFAGNVLILIEAKVPEEKDKIEGQRSVKVTPPKQPHLMMSKRLTERRHWSRRKLHTPVLPEFKPPKASDFEPTHSAHLEPIRHHSESSEPKELRELSQQNSIPTEADDLEESKVPHPLGDFC